MKEIGLFYAMNAAKTSHIAEKIREKLGHKEVEMIMIEKAWQNDFQAYDNLIVGASTWFDGELPTYWDEMIPEIESLDLKDKKVALFGLGDQIGYPDNFVDGLGILADAFEKAGAILVGFTSAEGYSFNRSRALRDGKWCGLVIDIENQSKLTDKRIADWCEQLKKESATASAHRSPSIPAETIPPAYPAPSPHGNNPLILTCCKVSLSLMIRTGAEVRVSTPIITASLVRKP